MVKYQDTISVIVLSQPIQLYLRNVENISCKGSVCFLSTQKRLLEKQKRSLCANKYDEPKIFFYIGAKDNQNTKKILTRPSKCVTVSYWKDPLSLPVHAIAHIRKLNKIQDVNLQLLQGIKYE